MGQWAQAIEHRASILNEENGAEDTMSGAFAMQRKSRAMRARENWMKQHGR